MSLEILPPELTESSDDTSKKSNGKFDSKEFFPSSLADGQSELFRPAGVFSTDNAGLYYRWPQEQMVNGQLSFAGFGYQQSWPGDPAPDAAREVEWSNPARPKIEGSFVRPKRALVWTMISQERNRVELCIFEQRSIKDGIVSIIGEAEDYTFAENGLANFLIKITRKGTGLETSYSVLPKLQKPTAAEVALFTEVADTAKVSKLLMGQHPMFAPKAEFVSAAAGGGDAEF